MSGLGGGGGDLGGGGDGAAPYSSSRAMVPDSPEPTSATVGPVMRRTAAGGAGSELPPFVRLGTGLGGPGGGGPEGAGGAAASAAADGEGADAESDDEEVQKRRGWRRARRTIGTPAMAIAAGLTIWLICFLVVDDPFGSLAASPSSAASPAQAEVAGEALHEASDQDASGASGEGSGGGAAAPSADGGAADGGGGDWGHRDGLFSAFDGDDDGAASGGGVEAGAARASGAAGAEAVGAHAAPGAPAAANASLWAAGRQVGGTLEARRREWFMRLTGRKNASGPAFGGSGGGDAWHRGAESLRNTGKMLAEEGKERLRKKEEELIRKREQVHTASVALASAISSGEVHRWVVWAVVAAFMACAVALQVLSSARNTLRRCVRKIVTRSLPVSLAPNELVTRPYSSWAELTVRVSLDFLNEPANLMLISIGSLQVLATWSKADPWRCKKINLLVLLLNFAYTIVQEVRAQVLAAKHDETWNSTACSRVPVGRPSSEAEHVLAKDISVGNHVRLNHGDICPATGELLRASHSFVLFNSLCETGEDCCSVLAVGGTVLRGFVLASEGAEVVVRVTETRNSGSGKDRAHGTPGSAKAHGGARGAGSRPVPTKARRMERFPEHMNTLLMQANLMALGLLFCGAVLAAALACAFGYHNPTGTAPGASPEAAGAFGAAGGGGGAAATGGGGGAEAAAMSQAERLLVTHFFSASVQLNTVIPSMRWVVLFFLYIFLVEAARPDVRVQNWRAFHGLDRRRIMYSDKTGTLTQVGMHVNRLRLVDSGADASRPTCEGLSPPGDAGASSGPTSSQLAGLEWLAILLMACNDCQPRPSGTCRGSGAEFLGLRPGTSPEEIALAEYLEESLGLVVGSNPLQPGSEPPSSSSSSSRAGASDAEVRPVHTLPLVLRDTATGRDLAAVAVLSRGGFDPAAGCREARIALLDPGGGPCSDQAWIVRQGGADVMAELAGRAPREEEMAREDQDRALGWSVARLGSDGVSRVGAWRYVARASFANPPRPASAPMVSHFRRTGLAVRMLTGDACIAALYIARQIHIAPDVADQDCLLLHGPDEPPLIFAARVSSHLASSPPAEPLCVVVPGAVVRRLIEAGGGSDDWLADERVSAVIYRTRAADKALIVGRTEELGRCRQRRMLASRSQPKCLARRHGEDGVCWMVGDAANDAEAISLDGVVGVSLRHGATPCKLGADFVVDDPGALVAVRSELHSRALAGARWLLEDVCLLSGLVSSLTLCGVWAGGFTFLPRGFLYDDPFDARIMTVFSGGAYPFSACAAACAAAAQRRAAASALGVGSAAGFGGAGVADGGVCGSGGMCGSSGDGACGASFGSGAGAGQVAEAPARPVQHLLLGAALGSMLGLVGPSDDTRRFGRFMLTATFSLCLLRHVACSLPPLLVAPRSWPCGSRLPTSWALSLQRLLARSNAGGGAVASALMSVGGPGGGASAAAADGEEKEKGPRGKERGGGASAVVGGGAGGAGALGGDSDSCAARGLATAARPSVRLAALAFLLVLVFL